MKVKKLFLKTLAVIGLVLPFSAFSAPFAIQEDPVNIRFEQYTGATGAINFWRLPSPGLSVFPGGSCTNLNIPPEKSEQASRFMALYLFAKTNDKKIFYFYDKTSCRIVSFGMDG